MPLPSPAPFSTNTSCPCFVSSRAPAGVMPTRYSRVLVSLGTPTFMVTNMPRRCQSVHREPAALALPCSGIERGYREFPGKLPLAQLLQLVVDGVVQRVGPR